MSDYFIERLEGHIGVVCNIIKDAGLMLAIKEVSELIATVFASGGRLLLCGNGGSAADAQHIATEFVSRFYKERRALDAEALTVNTSSLTAIGNDYGFDDIFARQVEAKGRAGDVFIGLSTSGKSPNVYKAAVMARELGLKTVCLIGSNKETIIPQSSDYIISVPSSVTPRIQECHILIGHIICEYVESNLFGGAA